MQQWVKLNSNKIKTKQAYNLFQDLNRSPYFEARGVGQGPEVLGLGRHTKRQRDRTGGASGTARNPFTENFVGL